ncbi:MAG: glycosyltransferase [Planctomycetota bacterium]
MRIAVASALFPPDGTGGAETVALNVAKGLKARGHEVVVLTTSGDWEGVNREIRFGLEVHAIGHHSVYWMGEASPRSALMKLPWHALDSFNPLFWRALNRLLRSLNPQVLLVHQYSGFSPVLWFCAKRCGIPVVQVLHDHHLVCVHSEMLRRTGDLCGSPKAPCRGRLTWLRTLASRTLDAVIAPSMDILTRHRHFGFFRNLPARVIPNGIVDPNPGVGPVPIPKDAEGNLGILGALEWNKGVLDFGRWFAKSALDSEGWRLRIAGRGSQAEAVASLAAKHPAIEYVGYVSGEEKRRFLAETFLLVMPSLCIESFGTVLLDAAAMGRPVLASRRAGGPSEIVTEGKTGWLIDVTDFHPVETHLRALRQEPGRWEAMSGEARRRFLEAFTLDRCVEAYEASLRSLL